MNHRFLLLAAGLLLALLVPACSNHDASSATTAGHRAKYFCPMHPNYTSDRPGDCPICNMKLRLLRDEEPTASATKTNVPVASTNDTAGTVAPAERTTIFVTPEQRQLIGLRVTAVGRRPLVSAIRATGVVQHDETRLARIAPRFGGWVQKLYVNFTGAPVAKGEPLFTVYSPELFAAESEYLLAARQPASPAVTGSTSDLATRQLVESARRKLELWQVGDEEIRALEERGKPGDELIFRAPVSGHVISKSAVEGKSFMPGETLYEIGEMHALWVRASLPEHDFARVTVGQKARVQLPGLGEELDSQVDFIYPHIDPATRRGEVRLSIDNARHSIRPDMWANVELASDLGERLAVPASAIIDTGTRCLAFVERADQHLEPRVVRIGIRTDDWWEVLDGLTEGEKVVTRALFLIDAESQLKAATAGMAPAADHH